MLGSGTESDPYRISTATDLQYISNKLSAYYILDVDIDCSGIEIEMIGIGSNFTGVFDGKGHTIKNLEIQGNGNQAFFDTVKNAIIKNVTFESSIIISNAGRNKYAAVLAVSSINSTIQNINVNNAQLSSDKGGGGLFNTFKVTFVHETIANNCNFNGTHNVTIGGQRSLGGFARYIDNQEGGTMKISCCNTELIAPDNTNGLGYSYCGGFVGYMNVSNYTSNYTRITDCSSNINLNRCYFEFIPDTESTYLGGFAGYCYFASNIDDEPILERCFSTGYLGGYNYIGGFMGQLKGSGDPIKDCYSNASIDCTHSDNYFSMGGFLGSAYQGDITLKNCYSTGKTGFEWKEGSKVYSEYGGFMGSGATIPCESCYWDEEASGATSSYGDEVQGKTTAEMQQKSTFIDWSDKVWKFIANNYPTLIDQCGEKFVINMGFFKYF